MLTYIVEDTKLYYYKHLTPVDSILQVLQLTGLTDSAPIMLHTYSMRGRSVHAAGQFKEKRLAVPLVGE